MRIAISRILTFEMSGKISLMHAQMKILMLLHRSAAPEVLHEPAELLLELHRGIKARRHEPESAPQKSPSVR